MRGVGVFGDCMSKPILCVDFDGVIHSYTSGWQGPRTIPDDPVPGAIVFLMKAREDFEVHIYSSRSRYWFGRSAMKRWLWLQLKKMGGGSMWTELDDFFGEVKWPKHKPAALVTIDDRAICFNGEFPPIEQVKKFKPWNKR